MTNLLVEIKEEKLLQSAATGAAFEIKRFEHVKSVAKNMLNIFQHIFDGKSVSNDHESNNISFEKIMPELDNLWYVLNPTATRRASASLYTLGIGGPGQKIVLVYNKLNKMLKVSSKIDFDKNEIMMIVIDYITNITSNIYNDIEVRYDNEFIVDYKKVVN